MSVLASTEEGGGVREINYIYAIPCPTGPGKFHVVVLVFLKKKNIGQGCETAINVILILK